MLGPAPVEAACRLFSRLYLDTSASRVSCFGFPSGRKGTDMTPRSAGDDGRISFCLRFITKIRNEGVWM